MLSKELILFYNVENFFLPDVINSGLKPSGLYNWTPYKYSLKVNRINNVFRFIQEVYLHLPMVIGLAEIGSKTVLEDLKQNNSLIENYDIIYEKSPDIRGLSVALLYDTAKLQLINYQTLNYQIDPNFSLKTRDIVHAKFLFKNKKLNIFLLHLPSKREGNSKKRHRDFIISELKNTVGNLTNIDEPVIVMGDFNEEPSAESIKNFALDNSKNNLINPFEHFEAEKKYTTYHHRNGVVFDQILFTEDLLKKDFNLEKITAEIFNDKRLRNKDNRNSNHPIRTYSGSRYLGGYSDHFPVLLKLESL